MIGSIFLFAACDTLGPSEFTVEFLPEEDAPESATISEGDSLQLPESDPEEGMFFAGWKEEGTNDVFTVLEDVDRDYVLVPVFCTYVETHLRKNLLEYLTDISFDLDDDFRIENMETRAIQGRGFHEGESASAYIHVSFMRIKTAAETEKYVIDHKAIGLLGEDAFAFPLPEELDDTYRTWEIFSVEEDFREMEAEWHEEMDLVLEEMEEFFDDDPIFFDQLTFTFSEDDLTLFSQELSALWDKEFTVSFDTGEAKEVPDMQVGFGDTIDVPEVEKDDYHLEGIYLDSEFEKRFDPSMRVQESLTLHYLFVSYEDLLDKEVTLTVRHAFGPRDEALLQELFDEFEKLHPNVTITQESKGTYKDLRRDVIEGIVAGVMPDIVIDDPYNLSLYLQGHALVPLDSYIDHQSFGTDTDDFVPDFLAESQSLSPSHTFALPFAKSPEVLYYNKTVFDYFGIDFDLDEALTWDEIESLAAGIEWTDAAKDALVLPEKRADFVNPHFVTAASAERFFLASLRQWGSPLTTPDGDIVIDDTIKQDMLRYLQGLFADDTLSFPYAWDESDSFIPFTEGRTLMSQDWGASPHLHIPDGDGFFGDFEVGVIPIIQKHAEGEGPRTATYRGPSIAMMADTTEEERLAAWFLMDFLTTAENNAFFTEKTGHLPVRQSAFANDRFEELLDIASRYEAGEDIDEDREEILRALTFRVAHEQMDDYAFDPVFTGRITSEVAHRRAGTVFGHFYDGLYSVDEAIEKLRERLEP